MCFTNPSQFLCRIPNIDAIIISDQDHLPNFFITEFELKCLNAAKNPQQLGQAHVLLAWQEIQHYVVISYQKLNKGRLMYGMRKQLCRPITNMELGTFQFFDKSHEKTRLNRSSDNKNFLHVGKNIAFRSNPSVSGTMLT